MKAAKRSNFGKWDFVAQRPGNLGNLEMLGPRVPIQITSGASNSNHVTIEPVNMETFV